MLKNAVGRYSIFFLFSHKACNVFVLPRFDLCHVHLSSPTNNFAHSQTLSWMSSLSGRMNIALVNIEFFTGCKKIKQRRISFVLGYLWIRMILWKISTAIYLYGFLNQRLGLILGSIFLNQNNGLYAVKMYHGENKLHFMLI